MDRRGTHTKTTYNRPRHRKEDNITRSSGKNGISSFDTTRTAKKSKKYGRIHIYNKVIS
jgi:hypothetical protein